MGERTVRVAIRGRVQGVGFRAWTASEARSRDLSGWVRNWPDGTVEAAFRGEDAAVAAMLAACRDGPPAGRVEAVDEVEPAGEVPDGFAIRHGPGRTSSDVA